MHPSIIAGCLDLLLSLSASSCMVQYSAMHLSPLLAVLLCANVMHTPLSQRSNVDCYPELVFRYVALHMMENGRAAVSGVEQRSVPSGCARRAQMLMKDVFDSLFVY